MSGHEGFRIGQSRSSRFADDVTSVGMNDRLVQV